MQTTPVDVRDAVVAVFRGTCALGSVKERFNGADRRRVGQYVAALQAIDPLPADDSQRRTLTRAANAVTNVSENGVYTEGELRAALVDVQGGKLTVAAATAAYGPSKSTLKRKLCELRAALPSAWVAGAAGRSLLESTVAGMKFASVGAPALFLEGESTLLLARAGVADQVGSGWSRKRLALEGQQLAHDIAAGTELSPPEAARLSSAVCGKRWQKRAREKLTAAGVPNGEAAPGKLSSKRARAAAPWLTGEMFDKFEALFADLHAKGVLKTPLPEAWQLLAGDEIGMDPTGTSTAAGAA
jgi:hypothetical protein